jgi:hypothetical protein
MTFCSRSDAMADARSRRAALARLASIAAATAMPAVAQPRALDATPPDAEGPFYPARNLRGLTWWSICAYAHIVDTPTTKRR